MATRFHSDTDLVGYGVNVEEDVRVIRQIEERARKLHNQLYKLEQRWYKRTEQLAKRQGVNIVVAYDFGDSLC